MSKENQRLRVKFGNAGKKRRNCKCLFRFFLEQSMNFMKVLKNAKQRRISTRKPVGMRHACGCSGRGQEPALCFSFTICMSYRQTDGEASSVWETTRISYMPSSLWYLRCKLQVHQKKYIKIEWTDKISLGNKHTYLHITVIMLLGSQ